MGYIKVKDWHGPFFFSNPYWSGSMSSPFQTGSRPHSPKPGAGRVRWLCPQSAKRAQTIRVLTASKAWWMLLKTWVESAKLAGCRFAAGYIGADTSEPVAQCAARHHPRRCAASVSGRLLPWLVQSGHRFRRQCCREPVAAL